MIKLFSRLMVALCACAIVLLPACQNRPGNDEGGAGTGTLTAEVKAAVDMIVKGLEASTTAVGGTVAGLSGPVVTEPLPVGPEIPDFKLTERSGRTVTLADMLGKVWIADFIFTRCSGPCPQLSARMQRMQMNFKDEPDVKLVSFTLDPKNDTPAALQDYAKRFYAEPDRWWFLTTSDEGEMRTLVQKGFLQTMIPASATSEIIHSEYFVLIDRRGRIRAAYPGLDADTKPRLVADVAKLVREPPGL